MSLSHKQHMEANDTEKSKNLNDGARLAQTPTSAVSWASVRCAQLISGCSPQGVRMPLNPPLPARPPTRVPLCCGLSSLVGASVRQAYYSYPEGVLSLLTGRHKYSSTSSPRVNGCPSGCREPYRRTARACCRRAVWARLSQRQGRLRRGRNVESHACSQRKQLQVLALECNPKTLLPSGVL